MIALFSFITYLILRDYRGVQRHPLFAQKNIPRKIRGINHFLYGSCLTSLTIFTIWSVSSFMNCSFV